MICLNWIKACNTQATEKNCLLALWIRANCIEKIGFDLDTFRFIYNSIQVGIVGVTPVQVMYFAIIENQSLGFYWTEHEAG